MPDELTRADSIRLYLSGAASAGGSQTDPNASLGNHRSSTEATSYGITRGVSPIANITVDFASGGNTEGAGTLEVTGVSDIRWKDSGGSYGATVTILNGETKVLEASGDPGAYIRVTRTSATALVNGTELVSLAKTLNGQFGLDDVPSADAAAGDDEYRCFMAKNVSSGSVTNFKMWIGTLGTQRVSAGGQLSGSGSGTISILSGNFNDWPASGWCRITSNVPALREIVYYSSRTATTLTVPADGRGRLGTSAGAGAATDTLDAVPGIRLAIDTEGVVADSEALQTIGNEDTAPASVSWNTGITAASGLNIGTLTTTQKVGIWIHRETPVGCVSTTQQINKIEMSFDA